MKDMKQFKIVLVSVITVAIFYIIFTRISFHSVIEIISNSNIYYLFIALVLLFIIILLIVKRWQLILTSMGYPTPFMRCFNVVMAALTLSSITPSKSGDLIKSYYLRNEIPISKTIGSVLTERIFDIFTLVLFSLIGMVLSNVFELAGIAFVVLLFVCLTFFIPKIRLNNLVTKSWKNAIENILFSMGKITANRKAFLGVLFLSILNWSLSIIQTIVLFYAIGIEIPFVAAMANIPIAIFIGLVPVTLGGMGTRDAAIIFLFSGYASPSELLSVGILFSIFRYWLPSILGIYFTRGLIK